MQKWPIGQSRWRKHWTQAPPWQTGVAGAQSVFCKHATQEPSLAHSLLGCEAQSPLVTHCTQLDVPVLHTGASLVVHCAFDVQPARHTKKRGSQTGSAAPQSELLVHWTH
jgi:hypothetical protein